MKSQCFGRFHHVTTSPRSANSVDVCGIFQANVLSKTCFILRNSSHGLGCWCSKGRESVSLITFPCALQSESLSRCLLAAPHARSTSALPLLLKPLLHPARLPVFQPARRLTNHTNSIFLILVISGGRDAFKWDDVKDNQHRENYLGHSLKARESCLSSPLPSSLHQICLL